MTFLTAASLAREVAALTLGELEFRGIVPTFVDELPSREDIGWRDCELPLLFHRVSVIRHITSNSLTWPLDQMSQKVLRDVAAELGIKLARPFPLETYRLEEIAGVDFTCVERHRGLCVRVVRCYDVGTETFPIRFSVIARWREN